MKVVGAFHCRFEPEDMLRRKVEVSLRYVDRLLAILDRWPEGERVLREYGRVEILLRNAADPDRVSGLDEWGRPMCEEGRLRQVAWDWCAGTGAEWFVFGDTDEIFTPDAIDFFKQPPADDGTDVYLLDIINLWGPPENGDQRYIGADNIYSPHRKDSNKRRGIVRYRPGSVYSPIPDRTHHVHPTPDLRDGAPIKTKLVKWPKVLHYKFADLDAWGRNPQSKTVKYQGYLSSVKDSLETVPRSWLWT